MAALALLLLSTATVVVALLVGTTGALTVAAVGAVALAWVAARLVHDQVVDERRSHAEDRVEQARTYRSLFLERSAEHTLFASRLRARVLHGDRLVEELRGLLRLAETRSAEAEARASSERHRATEARARVVELEAALSDRLSEVIDELAEWDAVPGVETDTVVDLLSWEERSTGARVVEQRRRA